MLSHIGAATRNDPSGNHGLEEAMILDDRPINLCDIRSGAMTHELIGHGAGGVLSLQWSPTQEFSLVSGGLDGTIKFWDVRKSGSGSCLFTLDCENKRLEEENEFIPRSKMDEDKEAGAFSRVGTKRRRHKESSMISRNVVGPSNYSKVQNHSVQSHNGPVTSLSFTPDGRFLVSASAADGIHLWYLQDGCCRSSQASTLAPTAFLGPSSTQPFPFRKKQRKTPLLVTQPGAWKSATVWAAGVGQSLLGYELHGRGGRPNNILTGHLDDIECMVSQDNSFRIMTGDKEGMILCWGRSLDYDDHDEQI
jgi:WD40 repeat protein